jgi:flagellar protein FliT
MPAQIEIYEQMRALSAQMVDAVHQADWDRLAELEQSTAALSDSLTQQNGAVESPGCEAQYKADLILGILEDDAEIRRHTEPWVERLWKFLGGSAKPRPINRGDATAPVCRPVGVCAEISLPVAIPGNSQQTSG